MKRLLVCLALVGAVVLPMALRAAQTSGSPVEEGLRLFLENRLDPTTLLITYSDIHPLLGGQELSVRGTGSVETRFVRQKAEPSHRLPSVQVRDLVKLLLQIEAWRQLTPDRQPHLDESRARLTIEVGSNSSEIWEWYNDLTDNNRVIRARDHIRKASGLK
jgi:hypothetical protein